MSYPGWNGHSAQAGPSQPRQTIPTSYLTHPQNSPMLSAYPATPLTSGPFYQTPTADPEASLPPSEAQQADAEPDQRSSPTPPVREGLGQLVEPHQELNDFLESFWTRQMDFVERDNPDFRTYPLPLARIKKVMKSDEEVKMISAEAPILFSKACELFISELTCRAWLIAESNKRRTLQKSDVAAAIALSDMFDFLIDILPRDDDGSGEAFGGDAGYAVEGAAVDEDGVALEGDDGDEGVEGGDGEQGEAGLQGENGQNGGG